ncbi:isoleucyl-tRNA synthetase [Babesia caballi]|uniref:Isoleucyl-tRNA synthetase n=1 Tax=Babesia caballi TaxID=5871 RepID=A0AAV4LSY5_BABCB|nr:isoleucyl-tRNA synthetase [Babesia caballi]
MPPELAYTADFPSSAAALSSSDVSTPPRRGHQHRKGATSSVDSLASLKFVSDEARSDSPSSSATTTPERAGLRSASTHSTQSASGGTPKQSCATPSETASPRPNVGNTLTPPAATDAGSKRQAVVSDTVERAAALTKVSVLHSSTNHRRRSAKQLLLNGSETTAPLEPLRKRANRRAAATRETKATAPVTKPPDDLAAPFWLSSPKDVKDIGSYVKAICSRVANIEKQMRRFESERQGLLNALYQLNLQQLQSSFPPSWSGAQGPSGDSTPQNRVETTISDLSGIGTTGISNPECGTTKPEDPGTTRDATAATVDHASSGSRSQPHYRTDVPKVDTTVGAVVTVNCIEATRNVPVSNHPGATTEASNAEYRHMAVREATSKADTYVIEIEDDDAVEAMRVPSPPAAGDSDVANDSDFFSSMAELSQDLTDASQTGNALDECLNFISGSQLERNVVNYNQQDCMEPNAGHEFRMWRSCQLTSTDLTRSNLRPRAPKCAPGGGRPRARDTKSSPRPEQQTAQPAPVAAEQPSDLLDRFWNMDFRALPQNHLARWAKFFGVKTSNSTRMMAEELDKIRIYLSAFCAK